VNVSAMPLGRIDVERWPTERPLFAAVLLCSLLVWALLIVSIFGVLYAVLFGAFFFVSHVAFVAHVRGSGVKLAPDQFPELHRRVHELAHAMGMSPAPEAYVMQAGGALNAFATRFLGRDMVILYSDLLEACGDNEGALDMIIAHELAHLKCGHLRWMWLVLPGSFVPFLGSALSRAREYTCDRFGLAGARIASDAALGLAILSAGPKLAGEVNLQAFVRQREETNTGWMTIGEWFSSHPPLSKRVAAIHPSLSPQRFHPGRGRGMALAILGGMCVVLIAGSVLLGRASSGFTEAMDEASGPTAWDMPEVEAGSVEEQVAADLRAVAAFIEEQWPGAPPGSLAEIGARWRETKGAQMPYDLFTGSDYGYVTGGGDFALWSLGPDGEHGTQDDIGFSNGSGR